MRRISMFELQELVRLHRLRTSCHEVARLLGVSPNTERPYREALALAGLLEGGPQELPTEAELQVAVLEHMGTGQRPPQPSSVQPWMDKIEKWFKDGAQGNAIYERLKREDPEFTGSLSAVKRACRRLRMQQGPRPEDVAIPVVTAPGQIAQVDFGYVGKLLDPKTMTMRKAWVFVMVLGHSRHAYCEITFDQKVETWLTLHVNAFAWFGGVPEVIVPDNLKSAVLKAAFTRDEDIALNRSYRELARHYGFKVDPTPPYSPEKKGKVESLVKYVKRSFFQAYRDELDAAALQQRLHQWVMETAGLRIHGTTRERPLEAFEARERSALRALPPTPYESIVWKKVKIHRDSHVIFDKVMYSVPWRFIGEEAWVRATRTSVQVHVGHVRVATHGVGKPGKRVTDETHLPEGRRDLRHRSRSYWLERAEKIGPETLAFVREVFDADDVLDQLRKVQAIVAHLEGFPVHRAEAACKRAAFYANYEYRAIKRILTEGLDAKPLPAPSLPEQPLISLARPRYARNIGEMMEQHMENSYEPN